MLYLKISEPAAECYLRVEELLGYKQTPYQKVAIAHLKVLGKTLLIDNKIQTCELEYKSYHEGLILPTRSKNKEPALILGAGEGVSIKKLVNLNYDVTAVDIDKDCIDLIDLYLKDWNGDIYSLKNRPFQMVFKGCLEHLKTLEDQSIQYLIWDLTEPSETSLSGYSEETFNHIYRVLKKGGVLSYQDGNKNFKSILTPLVKKIFNKEPFFDIKADWRFGHISK
jgi:spermidine synthase